MRLVKLISNSLLLYETESNIIAAYYAMHPTQHSPIWQLKSEDLIIVIRESAISINIKKEREKNSPLSYTTFTLNKLEKKQSFHLVTEKILLYQSIKTITW